MKKKVFVVAALAVLVFMGFGVLHSHVWCEEVGCVGAVGCESIGDIEGCTLHCYGGGTAICLYPVI